MYYYVLLLILFIICYISNFIWGCPISKMFSNHAIVLGYTYFEICKWNVGTQPSPCARKLRSLGKNNSNFSMTCVPCGCGSDPASNMPFLGRSLQSSTRCSGMGHGLRPNTHWKDRFGRWPRPNFRVWVSRVFQGTRDANPEIFGCGQIPEKIGKRREILQVVSHWKTSWDLRERRNKILGFGLGNDPGYDTSFWWVLFVASNPRILLCLLQKTRKKMGFPLSSTTSRVFPSFEGIQSFLIFLILMLSSIVATCFIRAYFKLGF